MKTKEQTIEFLQYVEMQLRSCDKPPDFILDDYLNSVLSCTEGYEDYFIVTHKDKEYPNVGLYNYSEVFKDDHNKA